MLLQPKQIQKSYLSYTHINNIKNTMVRVTERDSQNSPQEEKHGVMRRARSPKQFRKKMDGLILWQFLLDLLMSINFEPYIRWTGNKLEFLLIDGVVVFTEFQKRKWENQEPTPLNEDPGERWKDCLITKEDVKNRLRGLCSEYYKRNTEERDNKPLIEKIQGMKGGYAFMSHQSICQRLGIPLDKLLQYASNVGAKYEYPLKTRIFKKSTQKEEGSGLDEFFTATATSSNGRTGSSGPATVVSSPNIVHPQPAGDPIPDDFGLFTPISPAPFANSTPTAAPVQPNGHPVQSMQPQPQNMPQIQFPTTTSTTYPPTYPSFPTPLPSQNQFFRDYSYVEQDTLRTDGCRNSSGLSEYPTVQYEYVRYEQPAQLFEQSTEQYYPSQSNGYEYSNQHVCYQSSLQSTEYTNTGYDAYTSYRNPYQYPDYESDGSYYSCASSRPDTPGSCNEPERYGTPLLEQPDDDVDVDMLSATLTLASLVSDLKQTRADDPPSPVTEAIKNSTDQFGVDEPSWDKIMDNVINLERERRELTQL